MQKFFTSNLNMNLKSKISCKRTSITITTKIFVKMFRELIIWLKPFPTAEELGIDLDAQIKGTVDEYTQKIISERNLRK